jgi:hypothetical protein
MISIPIKGHDEQSQLNGVILSECQHLLHQPALVVVLDCENTYLRYNQGNSVIIKIWFCFRICLCHVWSGWGSEIILRWFNSVVITGIATSRMSNDVKPKKLLNNVSSIAIRDSAVISWFWPSVSLWCNIIFRIINLTDPKRGCQGRNIAYP